MVRHEAAINDLKDALDDIEAEHGEYAKEAALKRAFSDELGDEYKMTRR